MNMSDNFYNILMLILKDFSLVLGIVLLLLSLVVGVLMVFKPSVIINMNKKSSFSFGVGRSMRVLDMPRYVDHAFYRHHKIIGVIVAGTSIYILHYFTQVYDAAAISSYMAGSKYSGVIESIVSAMRLFLLLTGTVTLAIGVLMIIRPSLLKGIEGWSNRWVSTRLEAKPLYTDRDQVNQLVYKYPRLVGIIIISLSLYAAIGLIMIYI